MTDVEGEVVEPVRIECRLCGKVHEGDEIEDVRETSKRHAIDQHAREIASDHWVTTTQRVEVIRAERVGNAQSAGGGA